MLRTLRKGILNMSSRFKIAGMLVVMAGVPGAGQSLDYNSKPG